MKLDGKNIVIGVTGGIAAYKVCYVVSALKKSGANVFVIMTKNATEFVRPLTYETLSGNRVIVDTFDRDFEWEVEHVSLAKKADLFLVAPCTADFAGKLSGGIADDFLSTTAMAMKCPIVLAPAMNTNMLTSAAYKANEAVLRSRGVLFIEPGSGRLACGDDGKGRLAEPDEIVRFVTDVLLPKQDYEGKTVLVTAGGTSEPIDPVRFITNRSSGKMGVAIAEKAAMRGANVILVAGNISVPVPSGIRRADVSTTAEMYDAVMKYLPEADYIVKAAAPADYAVEAFSDKKIKAETLTLKLKKNPDIAAAVGKIKGDKKLIIFSAETDNCDKNAREKMVKKNADMVVLNDVTKPGAGFNTDTNIVTIITKSTKEELPVMEKSALADILLDRIVEL